MTDGIRDGAARANESAELNTLYRFYDKSGGLLYIGITNRLPVRMKQHTKQKSWWAEVAEARFEHFETRTAVEEAEVTAIRTENPLHNVAFNRDSERQRARRRKPMTPWEEFAAFCGMRGEEMHVVVTRLVEAEVQRLREVGELP